MKAKVITVGQSFGIIVEILSYGYSDWNFAYCKLPNNRISLFGIDDLEIIDEPEQLSKEAQAQAILFEGQCKLEGMIAANKAKVLPTYYEMSFLNLNSEIQSKLRELNQ